MKSNPYNSLSSKLNRIREEVEVLERPEFQSAFAKNLEDLITALSRLRDKLKQSSPEGKTIEVREPLEKVIGFLELAKSDESLRMLLALARVTQREKPQRVPIVIGNNLTNEDIRSLLKKDLSKAELAAIAAQRAITVGKSNNAEVKRAILRNLERQEGYGRLSSI